jgi:hypothetical protein
MLLYTKNGCLAVKTGRQPFWWFVETLAHIASIYLEFLFWRVSISYISQIVKSFSKTNVRIGQKADIPDQ